MKRDAPNHKLRKARFAKQMSRAALAESSATSAKRLWEIEKHGARVRLDTASRIADALETTIEALFDTKKVIG